MRLFLILLLTGANLTLAQSETVRLELGFDKQIVNNHWNPLRLQTRDTPDAELIITMTEGSVRTGDVQIVYRADIPGRTGVSVFEDDIYVPTWRSFSWALRTPTRILASGALDRRNAGEEPGKSLNLIVSARPANWLDAWPRETRVASVAASDLPSRLAAYDGVASILIDGTAPAPNLETVAAAAAGGTNVVLLEPVPDSHRDLARLVSGSEARLGTGHVLRANESGLRAALLKTNVVQTDLQEALLSDDLLQEPSYTSSTWLLLAASIYAVLCLFLLRFGGAAGLLTGVALAVLGSILAWSWLRPDAGTVQDSQLGRSLSVGSGGLSERLEVRTLLTLPGGDLALPIRAAPDARLAYVQSPSELNFTSPRWQSLRFYLKPQLESERLRWQGGALHNVGDTPLSDVYVFGLGPQGSLGVGENLVPTQNEQRNLPEVYNRVLSRLPRGSALARSAGRLYAALPETASQSQIGSDPQEALP